ncbi:transglutaminase N-terminal domain-containing protein [Methylotuvimicrobium sp. KM1]|uniref:transglutaminase family protein n=1 Tax=Methylotuvimicrobium sp. KM1 TaxID=3377707 RepID=UPI00384CFADA
MKYRITHITNYHYAHEVGLCQNEARLQPRDFPRQQCSTSRFDINPEPSDFQERLDFFGNRIAYFAIQKPHSQLSVTAVSEVEVLTESNQVFQDNPISWEDARDKLSANPAQQAQSQLTTGHGSYEALLEARQYTLDSPMVTSGIELSDYARPSFAPGAPLIDAVTDLMKRIYQDFTYDPSFTTIATPLADVMQHRRGVCQDFAHLAIGCLRSLGLAARYISGYIETLPAPGTERLVGADASHAWFAVFVPGSGWLELDPTNNKLPADQHITLAWGRDYADVTPLKGIAFGGGKHSLSVSVDVLRLES